MKIRFSPSSCSAHQASRSIAGRIPAPGYDHTAHRQQLQSSATAELLVQTFTIQFNAAALRKKCVMRLTPSSIDFWIVNSIFSHATSPDRGEYAAEIRDRRSCFQHLHFHAFFAGAGNFGVKAWLLPSNNCNACPGPMRSTRRYGWRHLRKARCENGWSVVQMINAGDTHS